MVAPLSPERLAEIRAREQAATAGSWVPSTYMREELDLDRPRTASVCRDDAGGVPLFHTADNRSAQEQLANAEFAAHARQDIPALLDEVERLAGAHQRAWELLSECRLAFFAALHDAPGLDGERGEALLRSIDAVREVVAEGCP